VTVANLVVSCLALLVSIAVWVRVEHLEARDDDE